MVRSRYHFDNIYSEPNKIGSYILYQIGDLYCNPGYQVPEHEQTVHEITYVVSGSGLCRTNGTETSLKPGMLYLNSIQDRHYIEASTDQPLRFFYLGFCFVESVSGPMAKLKAFFENPDVRFQQNTLSIQDAFIGMFSQLISRDGFSDILMESYMHQIICNTYRVFHHKAQYTYFFNQGNGADEQLVYDVVHYLDRQVGGIDKLSQLGDEFGYSYDYLSQKFSKVMGCSLKAHYTARRFERAQTYLSQGMSVTTVSELMGYKSIHAFSNAFKKQFGLSPSNFQKYGSQGNTINIKEE